MAEDRNKPCPESGAGCVNHYAAYGLRVRSEIPLPFVSAHPPGGQWDVEVRLGRTPETLPAAQLRHGIWEASPGDFLLRVRGTARYRVTDGREIVVEPHDDADPGDVRAFLVGSAMAALLQQRGIVTLHASAVQTPAGAALFAGPSGIGKSTLLAALVKRGHTMLADDVAGVVLDARNRPVVLSAYPGVRLWTPAMSRLGWKAGPAEQRDARGRDKHLVRVDRFGDVRTPLHRIFVLTTHNRECIDIEPLAPAAGFEALVRATYRWRFALGLDALGHHCRVTAAVARRARVASVTRPTHPFLLDPLADRVAEWMQDSSPGFGDGHAGGASPEAPEP